MSWAGFDPLLADADGRLTTYAGVSSAQVDRMSVTSCTCRRTGEAGRFIAYGGHPHAVVGSQVGGADVGQIDHRIAHPHGALDACTDGQLDRRVQHQALIDEQDRHAEPQQLGVYGGHRRVARQTPQQRRHRMPSIISAKRVGDLRGGDVRPWTDLRDHVVESIASQGDASDGFGQRAQLVREVSAA